MPGASAATPSLIGGANGVVGVPQTIEVRAPDFGEDTVQLAFSLGGQVLSRVNLTLNKAGSGSTVWTPTDAGEWTISGTGPFASAQSSTLTVAAVPTITTVYAVNQAQVNVATTITAVVEATGGTISPAGSVTFTNPAGSVLGTVALTPAGAGKSSANYAWTSTATTPKFTITAGYNPVAGVAGSANALTSSGSVGTEVLQAAPTVALKLAGSYTVGRQADVGALISGVVGTNGSPIQGSVAFANNVNGAITGISGSMPLTGGQATASWTPSAAGNQLVIASFSATNSFVSGTASQAISVRQAVGLDPISIGVQGSAAWPNGATIPAPANARIQLFTTTGSGASASISESGPCLVNGATLITATGAGACTLTVSSPGTSAFSASQVTVTLDVQAPAKKKKKR
jgi:hypothetical protein